ncbi:MAG: hypothetical protein AUG51_18635 [Acidobacteria bacterium 13_1_20CM_3_53_8]|nr:MAG: hypothetical protein AUG51_18635 [Acidobacteria bacterium 13_1_20CM_3_53_8]
MIVDNSGEPRATSDAFWHDVKGSGVELKPKVTERINVLEGLCKRGFQSMLELIKDLLKIKAKDRPDSAKVFTSIDAIRIQADLDLKENPRCYLDEKFTNLEQASPPSPAPSSNGSAHRQQLVAEEEIPTESLMHSTHRHHRSNSLAVTHPWGTPNEAAYLTSDEASGIHGRLAESILVPASPEERMPENSFHAAERGDISHIGEHIANHAQGGPGIESRPKPSQVRNTQPDDQDMDLDEAERPATRPNIIIGSHHTLRKPSQP